MKAHEHGKLMNTSRTHEKSGTCPYCWERRHLAGPERAQPVWIDGKLVNTSRTREKSSTCPYCWERRHLAGPERAQPVRKDSRLTEPSGAGTATLRHDG